ncbi:MAG: NADH:ubiquinone oxidoreductase subunit NDUFA12 [Pseudomonadota bacterium]
MGLLKSIFTWWDGPTIGTRLWSRRHGEEVGSDAAGNRYFKKAAADGVHERRWVIYAGDNEASRVPPEWHGWLHRTHDRVPEPGARVQAWVKDHKPNMTGTADAYARAGALPSGQDRPKTLGDYEAWSPDGGDDPAMANAVKSARDAI